MTIDDILKKLITREDLSIKESIFLADYIASDGFDPIKVSAALSLLSMKGESKDEIYGFIEAYSKKMVEFPAIHEGVDLAGTGGGKIKIGNISTASSFVLAAMGYKIIKHGNRSFTHSQGSADLLEKAGINIRLEPHKAYNVFKKTGYIFLFAQLYHPAVGKVSQIRKSLGFRTIFNKIGPFLNPAKVNYQLMGVSDLTSLKVLSEVGKMLPEKNFIFVHSTAGIDELIYGTKNIAIMVRDGRSYTMDLDYGKVEDQLTDQIFDLETLLKSRSPEIVFKSICLNSAAVMYLKNDVKSISEGIKESENTIINGDAYRKFLEFKEEVSRA